MRVGEIMTSSVQVVSSEKSVLHAAELMNEWAVGSLIVMDHGAVTGILTSRDVRATHPNRIVADAMTTETIDVAPDVFIWEALRMMDQHRTQQLLVMDGNKLAGIVTRKAIEMRLSEYTDPMTGLYRAPYIQFIGETLLRDGRPFHLLFIDLNDFGEINKQYGHPFGDDVIREFSVRLKSLIKDDRDYLCRYAGDEFVMISLAEESELDRYIRLFTDPIVIDGVTITAALGYVNGSLEPELFAMPFRDILRRASLLSTSAKR